MTKCKNCKTARWVRIYRVRKAPGVWQEIERCSNCGAKWKHGKPFREEVTLKRKYLGPQKLGGKKRGKKT